MQHQYGSQRTGDDQRKGAPLENPGDHCSMSTERRPQKRRIRILQPDDQAWPGMRHRPWAHLETSRKAGQRANPNGKTSSCTRSAFRPWRPSFPKSRAGLEHILVRHPLSRALIKTSGPCRRITSPAGAWPEYPPCMTNILQKSLRLMPLASIRLPHVVMIIICVLAPAATSTGI